LSLLVDRKNFEFLKIQDNDGRHIGNAKNFYISATAWPADFHEIWYGDPYWLPSADRPNVEFLKIHDSGGRYIGKVDKMQYLSNRLTDRHEI